MNQQEFAFSNQLRSVNASVRFGILPPIITMHDIDKMIGPHGENAQDAFDRDVSELTRDEFDAEFDSID